VAEIHWCQTCGDNVAGPSGECSACSAYRRKYSKPRPDHVILRHLARRARGQGMPDRGGLAALDAALSRDA
jgi:predicted ATP-dependent serine protease